MNKSLLAWVLIVGGLANQAWAGKSNPQLQGWFNTSKAWGGTVQSSNSKYTERDTVPLRFIANLTPGDHTLLLKYDFTDSGGKKHFFSSLGSYDATVAGVDLLAGTSFKATSTSNYAKIPADSTLNAGAQIPGVLTLYGCTAVVADGYSLVSGVKVMTVTITVPGSGTTAVPILVGYGGRLASESVWGVGNGASTWSGASGKAYASIDGSSDLNEAINPGAIVPSADLALSITSSPTSPGPGAAVAYQITVVNDGPDQATSVGVTNVLPPGVTFVSSIPAPVSQSGNNVAFALGSIAPLTSTNITLNAQLPAGQCSSLMDTAFVTSAVMDPTPSNNTNSVTITVSDSAPPTIACANVAAQTANADATCSATVPDVRALVRAQSSDNCTAQSSLTVSQNPTQGSTVSGVGSHPITVTVTDASNNSATCVVGFTVKDATPPSITGCAPAQTATLDQNTCQAAVPSFISGVTATDNCTAAGSLVIAQSPVAGTLVGPGITAVTITATDAAGNSATCNTSFTVTDKSAPAIACSSLSAQSADADATCSATVPDVRSLVQVQSSDNCTAQSSLTISQSPVQGTTVSGTGSHPITVTVTDASNNSATCVVAFTVNDTLAPVIACPSAPIIVDADPTQCGAIVNFSCPTATDNCGAAITVTCSPASGSLFSIGTNVVIATSSADGSGNTSQCAFEVVVKDSMNRAWPLAQALPLQATPSGVKEASFSQCLTALDQSRWYKFKVNPGSKVIVTLSKLKENYDLVLYKDIFEVYSNLLTETDAGKLSAQFAANAFSASAFSADAFSASAFSASAFSASAFSASAFSASAFSASAFSASAFSASAFSPDAFSASAFSPEEFSASAFSASAFSASAFSASAFSASAFSASAFSASAFSAAQMLSVIGGSAFEGIANEGVIVNTWDQTGDFYIRVRGRNGVFSPGDAFDLNVYEYPSACEGLKTVPVDNSNNPLPASTFAAPGKGYKTLIITDLSRWTPGTDVMNQLQAFTNRTEVKGCLVDVGQDAWVHFFNQQADQMFDCPFAKNLVAEAIKNIIDRSRNGNSLEYIVILGGDNVVPFFRYPDEALLGPERNYVPPVKDQSASQASLKYNLVPNQDFYGAKCDLSLKTMNLPLPDLAVGRLAETPSEVAGMLSAYNSTSDGTVPASTSLVTGYDFLADSSMAVSDVFQQGIGSVDTLISPNNLAPEQCWTADDLRAKLFGPRHDIVYLAGHFSAGSALAADFDTTVLATELTATQTDFKNALIFSAGCHSGYNVVNGDELPIVSPDPDWVQAAARKQATLVAGSGYQYGDTDTIEYSERLYLDFAKELRNALPGMGVPVGKALIGAKMIYLAGTPQMRGIHTKAYLEATLYGLPMLSFNLPNKAPNTPAGSSGITPTSYNSLPGSAYNLQYADFQVAPSLLAKHVTMTNIDAGTTVQGTYYEGSSGIINNPAEPILPIEVQSVGVSGTALRGVGFREGDYTDTAGLTPVTGAATTEIRGVHAIFFTQTLYPMQFWNVNYFGALCGLGDGATRLVAIPAQFQSSQSDFTIGTMRTFSNMKFRLFYNNDLSIYGTGDTANIPGQSGPPAISAIQGITSPDGSHVDISAHVVGNPTSGIQEVWVTYTGTNGDFYGKWRSLNLVQDPVDSTLWKGTLTLTGGSSPTPSHNVRYMVSAVTGNGVVTVDTKLGAYHIPDEFDSANTASLPKTIVQLAADNPSSGAYADTVTVKAKLTDTNGVALVNRLLVFSLGDQETFALTDGTGVATTKIQIRTEPGVFDLKASFPGGDQLAPSFDQKPFTITPQTIDMKISPTTIYAPPGGDTPLIAELHDGVGNYILERSVIFVMFDPNNVPVYAKAIITGISGRARLGKIPTNLLDGTYKITAYFNGQIPLPGGNTITLEDSRYVNMSADALLKATATVVVDGSVPTLSCTNYSVNTDFNRCDAYVSLDQGVASDPNLASVVFTPPSGTFNKGTTQVTCVATDKAGNQSTCKFNVVVSDGQKPTVTCPGNVTTTTGSGNCVATVNNIDATFSDNCPGATLSYTLSGATVASGIGQASGSTFNKGVTTVTYTATDASGNNSSCSFTVTVNDTTPPVVVGCPGDVLAETGTGRTTCDAVVNWTEPTATDNCGGSLSFFSRTKAPGSVFAKGTTLVTYVFKDASGNQASCTFNVTVTDTTPPTIQCPADKIASTTSTGAKVTFSVSASDNCGGTVAVTSVPASGSTFPIGTNTVVSTATDAAGNQSTCSFKVVVLDTGAPTVTLTADPNTLSPPNHMQVLITITVNATDNSNGTLTTRITKVESSDPTNTTGDGNTTGDWMFDSTQFITSYPGTLQLYVRSERAKSGPGRTYTIYVTTTDTAGNSVTNTVTVTVK